MGAPSGRGGSPGAAGLPRIPVVQAPGGSRGGEGTGGSWEMRGQRRAQLRGAGFVGGKEEEKGNLGAFLDCFWFAVVGIRAGNSAPRLSPKKGMGGISARGCGGEAQHSRWERGVLIEGVISTQSPSAAPHPLGNCIKGKRGPGCVTSTRVGDTGATSSPWPPPLGPGQPTSSPWPPSPWLGHREAAAPPAPGIRGDKNPTLGHLLQGQDNQHPVLLQGQDTGELQPQQPQGLWGWI